MTEEIAMEPKQEGITPFWKKLPFFFLFPFRVGPLVFMACLVGACAVAGFFLGGFGLAIKGFLAYLGLRYAFNVLELFSQGRFEGESVDHKLTGTERRPAKLGLVLALFIVLGSVLGNSLVISRVAGNASVQEQLLERYKQEHAEEIAEAQREAAAYAKRSVRAPGATAKAIDPTAPAAQPDPNADPDDAADSPSPGPTLTTARVEPEREPEPKVTPYGFLTREEVLEQSHPVFGDALWFKLLPISFWLGMAALSLILPSAALVIALEDKFFAALNPLRTLDFIKSMGSAYFALWALFLLIAGTRQVAMRMGENWPTAVRFPVEMGVATYLALVLFAMMGYAVYQFHQELGLDVSVDFDSHRKAGGAEGIAQAGSAHAALRAQEPTDPLERKVQALLAEGNVKEAIAEVKDHMRYDRLDPVLNARLHTLYMQQGDTAVTLTHGQQWLNGLVKADKGVDALRVPCRQCSSSTRNSPCRMAT